MSQRTDISELSKDAINKDAKQISELIQSLNELLKSSGFRVMIASSEEKTKAMAREMESYQSSRWDSMSKYTWRGDPIDKKYEVFLMVKQKDLLDPDAKQG